MAKSPRRAMSRHRIGRHGLARLRSRRPVIWPCSCVERECAFRFRACVTLRRLEAGEARRSSHGRRPCDVHPGRAPGVLVPCHRSRATMMNLVRNFLRDENGEDLIEYGLLAAFVAAVALVTIIADPLGIKGSLTAAFQK